MASTRLIPLHVNKGKTVAKCLKDRTDYAQNPDKTESREYVTGYMCNPETVDEEFTLSKRKYLQITGKDPKHEVIAYQIRQSFKPGEITPEEANQIGQETALSFTKGNHAFIVATHTDKAHIHNHIIFNSTSLDCTRKFKDFYFSALALRRISDIICAQHGLSIITPRPYREREKYHDKRFKPSIRSEIRQALDEAIAREPKDFDSLLKLLEEDGWIVRREKRLAIQKPDGKKPILFSSLGEGYTEDDLVRRIFGEEFNAGCSGDGFLLSGASRQDRRTVPKAKPFYSLIDLQQKLIEGKGGGYQHWGKVFNVKQTAKTISYLKERGIDSYDQLKDLVGGKSDRYTELSAAIKAKEKRLGEIRALRNHIINYAKTNDTYAAYRKSGFSKKFYEEHADELILRKAAKEAFDELGGKLPTVKQLNQEFYEVLADKKKEYDEYKKLKAELRELQVAKKNMEIVLEIEVKEGKEKKEQAR